MRAVDCMVVAADEVVDADDVDDDLFEPLADVLNVCDLIDDRGVVARLLIDPLDELCTLGALTMLLMVELFPMPFETVEIVVTVDLAVELAFAMDSALTDATVLLDCAVDAVLTVDCDLRVDAVSAVTFEFAVSIDGVDWLALFAVVIEATVAVGGVEVAVAAANEGAVGRFVAPDSDDEIDESVAAVGTISFSNAADDALACVPTVEPRSSIADSTEILLFSSGIAANTP